MLLLNCSTKLVTLEKMLKSHFPESLKVLNLKFYFLIVLIYEGTVRLVAVSERFLMIKT